MNYNKITTEFTENFFDIVKDSKNIVITSHIAPDGDSISCVLSMYRVIKDNFIDKDVRIVYSNNLDDHFKYFENFEKIEWTADVAENLNDTDMLIVLDCSNYNRFAKNIEKIKNIKNKICIDHHESTPDEFDLGVIIPSIRSCSELVFRLFENNITLDKNLAETFLLGILTDTGSFTFLDYTQSDTFLIAKKLIDAGKINITTLKMQYSQISKREFNLMQEFIKNTSLREIEGWPPFQYTYVDREVIERENYTKNEITAANTAYISGHMNSLKGYTWGFIVKPKPNFCSVSMRALPGSVNVRDLLERMSLGSGHDRSAGGIFKAENDSKDPKVCIEKIIEWMKNNKPVFN